MTIYGVGYRSLSYRPTGTAARLWPIASLEFRSMLRTRAGVLLFLVCQVPAVVGIVLLLIAGQLWQLGGPERARAMIAANPQTSPTSASFYLDAAPQWLVFALFLVLTFVVSCRAIAKDRQSNALEIYWTRGITPLGYFVGKWAGSVLLLGVGFVAVPFLLWVLGWFLLPDPEFLGKTMPFMPRLLLARVVFTALLAYLAVGFSALSRSANLSAMLWAALAVGSAVVGRMFRHLLPDESWLQAVSPWHSCRRLVDAIAGVAPRQELELAPAAVALAAVSLALALALRRRLRLEDAVS